MEITVERVNDNQYKIKTNTPYNIDLERDMIELGLRLNYVQSSIHDDIVIYHVTYGRRIDVTSLIIHYEQGELDDDEIIELFQLLVDTGNAWTFPGHYGRTAFALAEAGLIHIP